MGDWDGQCGQCRRSRLSLALGESGIDPIIGTWVDNTGGDRYARAKRVTSQIGPLPPAAMSAPASPTPAAIISDALRLDLRIHVKGDSALSARELQAIAAQPELVRTRYGADVSDFFSVVGAATERGVAKAQIDLRPGRALTQGLYDGVDKNLSLGAAQALVSSGETSVVLDKALQISGRAVTLEVGLLQRVVDFLAHLIGIKTSTYDGTIDEALWRKNAATIAMLGGTALKNISADPAMLGALVRQASPTLNDVEVAAIGKALARDLHIVYLSLGDHSDLKLEALHRLTERAGPEGFGGDPGAWFFEHEVTLPTAVGGAATSTAVQAVLIAGVPEFSRLDDSVQKRIAEQIFASPRDRDLLDGYAGLVAAFTGPAHLSLGAQRALLSVLERQGVTPETLSNLDDVGAALPGLSDAQRALTAQLLESIPNASPQTLREFSRLLTLGNFAVAAPVILPALRDLARSGRLEDSALAALHELIAGPVSRLRPTTLTAVTAQLLATGDPTAQSRIISMAYALHGELGDEKEKQLLVFAASSAALTSATISAIGALAEATARLAPPLAPATSALLGDLLIKDPTRAATLATLVAGFAPLPEAQRALCLQLLGKRSFSPEQARLLLSAAANPVFLQRLVGHLPARLDVACLLSMNPSPDRAAALKALVADANFSALTEATKTALLTVTHQSPSLLSKVEVFAQTIGREPKALQLWLCETAAESETGFAAVTALVADPAFANLNATQKENFAATAPLDAATTRSLLALPIETRGLLLAEMSNAPASQRRDLITLAQTPGFTRLAKDVQTGFLAIGSQAYPHILDDLQKFMRSSGFAVLEPATMTVVLAGLKNAESTRRDGLFALAEHPVLATLSAADRLRFVRLATCSNGDLRQPLFDALTKTPEAQSASLRQLLQHYPPGTDPYAPLSDFSGSRAVDYRIDRTWQKDDVLFYEVVYAGQPEQRITISLPPRSADADTTVFSPSMREVALSLAHLPDKERRLVHDVVIHPTEQEIMVAGETAHAAMDTDGRGLVNIYGKPVPWLQREMTGSFIHEVGHNLAKSLWKAFSSPAWRQAIAEDSVAFSGYAGTAPAEDFADSLVGYFDVVGTAQEDEFRTLMPHRFAMLDAIFHPHTDASAAPT